MDFVLWYNVLEAALWTGFAVLTGTFGRRVRGMTPWLQITFAVSFLAFGLSDVIETQTGA